MERGAVLDIDTLIEDQVSLNFDILRDC